MQTGSAEKCLSEEYGDLLEAVLSMPLALMSSMLHDIAAAMTFYGAALAARALLKPPHRWHHHADKADGKGATSCVQFGFRMQMWTHGPLTLAEAPERDTDEGAAGEDPDAEEPPPAQVVPAMEVGMLHGTAACVCDPPVAELWRQAGVQEETGVPPQEPRLDPSLVDFESTMLVRTPGSACCAGTEMDTGVVAEMHAMGWQAHVLVPAVSPVVKQRAAAAVAPAL